MGVPFLKKKAPAMPPRKPLPTIARGVLQKESLLPKTEVPNKLPTIAPKQDFGAFGDAPKSFGDAPKSAFGDIPRSEPKKELPAFGDKTQFSEHKYESVFDQPETKHLAAPAELEASFFSDLAKHLSNEEELLHKKLADPQGLLNRNLVAEMKEYWDAQKATTTSARQHREIESDVLAQVDELRRLEADWQRLEQDIEEAKVKMMEKERQIETESKKLKLLMRRWGLKKDIPKEQWFYLKNGLSAKNVPELAFHLRKLDNHHFYAHVTAHKNDFATWIRDVFHDEELASALEQEHEKHKIVELLDKATN